MINMMGGNVTFQTQQLYTVTDSATTVTSAADEVSIVAHLRLLHTRNSEKGGGVHRNGPLRNAENK